MFDSFRPEQEDVLMDESQGVGRRGESSTLSPDADTSSRHVSTTPIIRQNVTSARASARSSRRSSGRASRRGAVSDSGDGGAPNPRSGPYSRNAGLRKCKRNAKRPPRQQQQPLRTAFGAVDDDLGPESEDEMEEEEGQQEEGQLNPGGHSIDVPQEGTPQLEALPPIAIAFISALCNISLDAIYHTLSDATYTTSVHRLIGRLMGNDSDIASDSLAVTCPGHVGEAARLAISCGSLEKDEARLHAEYYFTTMQLAAMAQK